MNSTFSGTPVYFTVRRRLACGLWASAFIAMNVGSLLVHSLGAASQEIGATVCRCGPIDDTIEFLLWLLQQL